MRCDVLSPKTPRNATATGGPRNVDALTYLCFSTYLRDDRERSADFVRAATALLDAGADVNTGFFDPTHRPEPEWESAIYGAAGVAHHPELTRLLIERGGNPNDEETQGRLARRRGHQVLARARRRSESDVAVEQHGHASGASS
jgi:hypothetical protein